MVAGLMVGAWFLLFEDEKLERRATGSDVMSRGPSAAKPPQAKPKKRKPALPEMSCPAELTNCEVASGRVIYVEAVDPDGDGDAHFVTLSNQSITTAGITVFDVGPHLRPEPLPGRGDLIGGYGPVYQGSYGQRQIEVIEFHVAK